MEDKIIAGAIVAGIVAFFVSAAAIGTHIVVCLKAGLWGYLIAGALIPFVGVIHGIGIWFGYW